MEKEKEYLLWFEQMERKDVAIVGGKSSSLGEMTAKTDVPVPYGYATTAYAYRYFIEKTGLKEKMAALIGQITDVENTAQLRDISAKLRKAIMDEEMPKAALTEAIPYARAFSLMMSKRASRFLAVSFFESSIRSSSKSGANNAAAAKTGPARGPRPASSTPTMSLQEDE